MAGSYRNKHGRTGGRGIRPWLLIPKVLAVAAYFGSLLATTALWFSGPRRSASSEAVAAWIEQVSGLFRHVVVPALLLSMLLGGLLLAQHANLFVRMRWWRVKMASLLVGIPISHLFMSSRFIAIRRSLADGQPHHGLEQQIEFGLLAVLAWSAWLIFLGRHKPTFGQNWAKTFAAARAGLLIAALGLIGCQNPSSPAKDANLALRISVHGRMAAEVHPVHETATYVLEPNRRLHVAVGRVADRGLYPRRWFKLSPPAHRAVFRFINEHHLTAEPTSPGAQQNDAEVVYDVLLTKGGLIHHYRTTPAESPPTMRLLAMLIRLTGRTVPPLPPATEERPL